MIKDLVEVMELEVELNYPTLGPWLLPRLKDSLMKILLRPYLSSNLLILKLVLMSPVGVPERPKALSKEIVLSKTNTRYVRSATLIDLVYCFVLYYFKEVNNIPMSTISIQCIHWSFSKKFKVEKWWGRYHKRFSWIM